MENTGLFNAEGKALSIADVMAMLPTAMINRVEVIDENGRSYVNWEEDNDVSYQLQDDGRTLKVFVNKVKPKSSVEEAYKRWMGQYPPTGPSVDGIDDIRWRAFQMGYNAAYAETVAPLEEEHKTLYDILRELDKPMLIDDVCSAVKKWMSQYTHNVMTGEYLKGYEECLTVLEENLK